MTEPAGSVLSTRQYFMPRKHTCLKNNAIGLICMFFRLKVPNDTGHVGLLLITPWDADQNAVVGLTRISMLRFDMIGYRTQGSGPISVGGCGQASCKLIYQFV